MIRSTDRIKTTHAGTLPKAKDLARMVASKAVHATAWRPTGPDRGRRGDVSSAASRKKSRRR